MHSPKNSLYVVQFYLYQLLLQLKQVKGNNKDGDRGQPGIILGSKLTPKGIVFSFLFFSKNGGSNQQVMLFGHGQRINNNMS